MSDVKLTHKRRPIVPFNMTHELYALLLKHRHITSVPTVAHIRNLIKKDIEVNPTNYGLPALIS